MSRMVGTDPRRLRLTLAIVILLSFMFASVVPMVHALSSEFTQSSTVGSGTCLDGGIPGTGIPLNVSVAIVKPVFTSTPYSQYNYGSFYAFYHKYRGATGNITTDLGWLNTSVLSGIKYNSGWGHTYPLYAFFISPAARYCGLDLGKNVNVISDINVTDGALFNSNGTRRFDAAVIGHQEYVTQAEYDQFRRFVATGGHLIAMSSNEFYAKVKFDPKTLMETFVTGHGGFAFNGHTAWYGTYVRPPWNTSGWFGSVYCCFHKYQYKGATVNATNPIGSILNQYFGGVVFKGYTTHEENAVSNTTRTSIVAMFLQKPGLTIASYIHWYGKGAVVCFCVFGEDLVSYEKSTQMFLVRSLTPFGLGNLGANPPAPPYPLAVVTAVVIALGVSVLTLRWRRRAR